MVEKRVLSSFFFLLLVGVPVLIASAQEDTDGGIEVETDNMDCPPATFNPDSPRVLLVDWERNESAQIEPMLNLRTLGLEGLTYSIDGRVRFSGQDVEWSLEAWTADPMEEKVVAVSLPEDAYMDELQQHYTSDLIARVIVYNAEGEVIRQVAAPPLQMVWLSEENSFLLMDQEEAAEQAPGRIYTASYRDGLVVEDEDSVYEYGGM